MSEHALRIEVTVGDRPHRVVVPDEVEVERHFKRLLTTTSAHVGQLSAPEWVEVEGTQGETELYVRYDAIGAIALVEERPPHAPIGVSRP